ncbi:MAG: hypothetical protein FJ098_07520 [Deltaproteobacteria bacterium]|nr:hypothetical protein [Deltaproteobacteria bacterium]
MSAQPLLAVLLAVLSPGRDCGSAASAFLARPVPANRAAVEAACTLEDVLATLRAAPPWMDLDALPEGDVVPMDQGFYLLDVPDGYTPDRPWPLILSLHGNPPGHSLRVHRLYWQRDTQPAGFLLASPDLEWGHWREPEGQERVLDTLRDVLRRFHVDPDQIHLAGYSSGGVGAWYFGTWLADLWATVNVRCGLRTSKMGPMENLAKIGVYLIHAAGDRRCAPSNARDAARDLEARGFDHVFRMFPGDHDFQWDDNGNVMEWMRSRRLRDYGALDYTLQLEAGGRLVRWLWVAGEGRTRVRARAADNRIELTVGDLRRLRGLVVYLNEDLADPARPVTVVLNGEERYRGLVLPDLDAFLDAWTLFPSYSPVQPRRIFTARVSLFP